MDELFHLKWDNFQKIMSGQYSRIRDSQALTDITFVCEGKNRISAHKLVLYACSPLFRDILERHPCPHPIFFLSDVKTEVLQAIISYMYNGEAHISNEYLKDFIKTAEQFRIRGISKEQDDLESSLAAAKRSAEPDPLAVKRSRPSDLAPPPRVIAEESRLTCTLEALIEKPSSVFLPAIEPSTSQPAATVAASSVPMPTTLKMEETWSDASMESIQGATIVAAEGHDRSQRGGKMQSKANCLSPQTCPVCNRVYSNVSNLRQHMRLIHNPTAVFCPLCSKSFNSDLYMRRHYTSTHGPANGGGGTGGNPESGNVEESKGNVQPATTASGVWQETAEAPGTDPGNMCH